MGACGSKGGENAKGSTAQVLDNQTTLSDIRKSIKEKLEVHSQTSTQKSVSSQNVTIIQETDPEIMNSPMFQTQTFKYWPWGSVREGPCPNYGCIYDVEQVNEINVSSFKEDLVNDSQEIWNNIKTKLKKNAKLQMTGNNEGLEILNSAIEKSESEVNDKITDILTKMTKQDFDDEQNIEIVINSPIKCSDPCSGGNPRLSQNALIEMKSSDIINSALAIIHKNASDMGLDTKLKAEDTDSACMVQMILSCVFCIICIVLIYMFISPAEGEEQSAYAKLKGL